MMVCVCGMCCLVRGWWLCCCMVVLVMVVIGVIRCWCCLWLVIV